jgi:hypothetical protein
MTRAELLRAAAALGRATALCRDAMLNLAEPEDEAIMRVASTLRGEFQADDLRLGLHLMDELRAGVLNIVRVSRTPGDYADNQRELDLVAGLTRLALNLDRRLH